MAKTETVEQEKIKFISMDHDIVLIRENDYEHIQGGRVVSVPHKKIVFNGPYFLTDDPNEIEHIRGLDSFNKRIFEHVIPDDMVQTGTEKVTRFMCSYPDCEFVAFTKDMIKDHKKEEHSKKKGASNGSEGSETKKSKKAGSSSGPEDMVES